MISKNTAAILWDLLDNDRKVPILWNALPFHPHRKDMCENNRRHDPSEIEEGKKYMKIIYNLFNPKKLYSLVRVGETILKELFLGERITAIRHPSCGGKISFIVGMLKIYIKL